MVGFLSEFTVKGWFFLRIAIAICCGMPCLFLPRTAHAVAPAIYGQPMSQAVLPGSNATFVVSAAASPLTYQWRFNGGNVSGATNSAFTITNVQTANTGAYAAVISNSSGAITSSPANLYLATPPDFLWARQVTNGIPPNYAAISGARHVAADSSGNVFVAGTFYGGSPATIDFGGVTLTNVPGLTAVFVCKYDRSGNVGWARLVATNSDGNWPLRLAADSVGNVYFAGRFSGAARFGTNTLVSSGPGNLFLAKYDAQGNALWARQIVAYDPSSFLTLALASDLNANVFVSSRYTNVANVSGTVVTNSSSFMAKYDSAAGNLVWAKPCLAAEALTVGLSSSIYTTGSQLAPSATPGSLAKYDSTGNVLWSRPFPHGQTIAVDASENIYATGWGGGAYADIAVTNVNGVPDFFIARCDTAGQLKWLRQVGSTNQPFGVGLALDAFGNIYAAALSANARREVLAFGPVTLTNTYSFLAKYNPIGNALWAVAPGGTNFAMPYGMSLVDHQEIYLAGQFKPYASFGRFNLFDSNPTGSGAFYVAKFAADTSASVTLGSPQIVAGGSQVQFSVAGVPGYKYAVEGSANLVNWTPISTNTSPFVFSETISSAGTQRFYRSAYRP
jgi:hypothetical protein